jgi:hypothetical protein
VGRYISQTKIFSDRAELSYKPPIAAGFQDLQIFPLKSPANFLAAYFWSNTNV